MTLGAFPVGPVLAAQTKEGRLWVVFLQSSLSESLS